MIKTVDAVTRPDILRRLRAHPGANASALQDLQAWPDRTTMHYREPTTDDAALDYLLISGHPGIQKAKNVILGGAPAGVEPLLVKLPEVPWLMRQTSAVFLDIVQKAAPQAKVYADRRMEVTRSTFVPGRASRSRRLTDADAAALAAFHGAPPQAAGGFLSWIRGAMLVGAWDGARLVAIASAWVRIPEVWYLVGIKTLEDVRGKGFGTDVTSTITALGLEAAPVVDLSVMPDNVPALKLYERLGFVAREDQIWVDHGADSSPEM